MESVNETLNIGAGRKAARRATIPGRVLPCCCSTWR